MANLVFKYRWNHGPYPMNSAQGKQQFMLPFASGIPNLSPAFSQIHDIPVSNPASRSIGTALGDVVEVGAFGLGRTQDSNLNNINSGFFHDSSGAADSGWQYRAVIQSCHAYTPDLYRWQIGIAMGDSTMYDLKARIMNGGVWSNAVRILNSANTTIDANGFIKAASPIAKLYAYKVELNDDAAKQPLEFEKLGIGDYLLKGSLGLAQEGWYIEVPKDANGNNVVAVEYRILENGDLSIKTYKRKFDFELAAIVADHENPVDIPDGRWIDIRLHEEPEVISNTPVNFQPTNLSQAVSAALEGLEPPEASDID